MRARDTGPRVVAELGRPETPEETIARKAEASRKRRANQTVRNLVLALLASLGIVVLLVLVVVRPEQPAREAIDYVAIAAESQSQSDVPLAVPVLPEGWSANNAVLQTETDQSLTWRIGFVAPGSPAAPGSSYVALDQGIAPQSDWLSGRVDSASVTSTLDIGGREWDVYDRRDSDPTGNYAYSLATAVDGTIYLVHGVAGDEEFITLASAIAADLDEEAQ